MSDIIAEIQKAIEKAAKEKFDDGGFTNTLTTFKRHDQSVFKYGAAFILPLLKKAIEDRDNYIRLCEHFERPHEKDSEIRVCNNEILELLGEKHE